MVVGLPVTMAGRGPGGQGRPGLPGRASAPCCPGWSFELVDERLSTVAAERALVGGGVRRRDRRQVVDQVAASVFLQTWLDRRR